MAARVSYSHIGRASYPNVPRKIAGHQKGKVNRRLSTRLQETREEMGGCGCGVWTVDGG